MSTILDKDFHLTMNYTLSHNSEDNYSIRFVKSKGKLSLNKFQPVQMKDAECSQPMKNCKQASINYLPDEFTVQPSILSISAQNSIILPYFQQLSSSS